MNLTEFVPLEFRLFDMFVLGACVGSLVNLCVYRLAWHPRAISPWSLPSPEAPPRHWYDRMPILGWLGLRRERSVHGRGFWIRPLLVEVLCGVAFAALYWWEIDRGGLLPPNMPWWARDPLDTRLHVQYACHVVLICLMLVGSLIDIDEKVIPDSVTVPGTLIGLAAAALYPGSLLPVLGPGGGWTIGFLREGGWAVDFLHLTSPNDWPDVLSGFPHAWPLVIALGCWWLWCVALMHRTWYARHGWLRALKLFCVRLRREASTWWILLMGLIGSAGIVLVWLRSADSWQASWQALLSALVGMAAGGGLVWTIRIIATAVLRREAMGFGDVTLMAMIGAFLGWQPCLIVFFLAPFGALLAGMINLILHRQPEIFYGPFLCLATLAVIVGWAGLWQWLGPVFGLGQLLVLVVLVCLVIMVPLLVLIRTIRTALGY